MSRAATAWGALALAGLVGAAPAIAAPPSPTPIVVLWLDGPNDAVAKVDAALVGIAAPPQLGADDGARRALIEGGPSSRVASLTEAARGHFAAQRFREADAALAEAEALALGELRVAEARAALGEIEPLRLMTADFLRDEPAATRAARLLALSEVPIRPELAAAVARHKVPAAPGAVPSRVESDPPGADVYVDLQRVGKTPLALPASRRADALIDVELAGHRRVHRPLPGGNPVEGTLAVTLAPLDALPALIDRVRAARGNAAPASIAADVAAIGRRVGAARVLVLRRTPAAAGAPERVDAAAFDVGSNRWSHENPTFPLSALTPGLPRYAVATDDVDASTQGGAGAVPSPAAAAAASVAKPAAPVPAWKHWYTWVAGGVLLAGVVALVVVYRVGNDQVTVTVQR